MFCEFAPLTCHVSIGSLRYRIECILSETLVFMGTSKEAFSILFYIHFGQVAPLGMVDGPGRTRNCGQGRLASGVPFNNAQGTKNRNIASDIA